MPSSSAPTSATGTGSQSTNTAWTVAASVKHRRIHPTSPQRAAAGGVTRAARPKPTPDAAKTCASRARPVATSDGAAKWLRQSSRVAMVEMP
jgi:hypothetical protein